MAKGEVERLKEENELMRQCFSEIMALNSMSDSEVVDFLKLSPAGSDFMRNFMELYCGKYWHCINCVRSVLEKVSL